VGSKADAQDTEPHNVPPLATALPRITFGPALQRASRRNLRAAQKWRLAHEQIWEARVSAGERRPKRGGALCDAMGSGLDSDKGAIRGAHF
jgi:hypothetical protein